MPAARTAVLRTVPRVVKNGKDDGDAPGIGILASENRHTSLSDTFFVSSDRLRIAPALRSSHSGFNSCMTLQKVLSVVSYFFNNGSFFAEYCRSDFRETAFPVRVDTVDNLLDFAFFISLIILYGLYAAQLHDIPNIRSSELLRRH
jgi:hypothetical protein